jgi:diacylglycerol kinase family enzyme/membrane-associated phospholipid phosphatase
VCDRTPSPSLHLRREIEDEHVTDSQTERRASIIAAALAIPFAVLMGLVLAKFPPLIDLDRDVVDAWHGAVRDTGWANFFDAVEQASRSLVVSLAMLGLATLFFLRREIRTALWIGVIVLITDPLWGILKQVVHRHRPDIPHQLGGYSFPSGHATSSAALAGVLIVLTHQRVRSRRLRMLLIGAWAALAALIGVDRVFAGAHYPSDVVAGWLLGALVVFVVSAVFGVISTDPLPPPMRPLSTLPETRTSLAVVLNPIKIDAAESFKLRVGAAARAAGWDEPMWFETTVDDAGASMTRAAIAAGADVVVAAGGDGTVRVVCAQMAGTGVPVGIVPAGTGNLLARNLGIPLSHDLAIDTILNGQDRAIDTVRIEGDDLAPTRFVVMAGLGLDAAIMADAPEALKARIGWPAYVVAGARQLRYPALRVDISVDGEPPVRRRARTVVIGNVGSLQAGIPLLPDALIDDGLLDVVVIAPRQVFGWIPVMLRVLTRRRTVDDRLDRYTGRHVEVTAAHSTPRQLDGDIVAPGTQILAEVEPGRLLIRVPR